MCARVGVVGVYLVREHLDATICALTAFETTREVQMFFQSEKFGTSVQVAASRAGLRLVNAVWMYVAPDAALVDCESVTVHVHCLGQRWVFDYYPAQRLAAQGDLTPRDFGRVEQDVQSVAALIARGLWQKH